MSLTLAVIAFPPVGAHAEERAVGPHSALSFSTPYDAEGSLDVLAGPGRVQQPVWSDDSGGLSVPAPGVPRVIPVSGVCGSVPLPVGCEAWSATYDPADGAGLDWATDVAASPSGEQSYVVGGTAVGNSVDMFTAAYDVTTGDELWSARFDGQEGLLDLARSVTVSPDGSRVYVAGFVDSTDLKFFGRYGVVAYSAASGEQLWSARYAGRATFDLLTAIVPSADGSRVFVTGGSWDGHESQGGTGMDVATVAYDAASGQRLWVQRYDGGSDATESGWRSDAAWSMTAGPDGRVYVAGYSVDPTGYIKALVIAYDVAGDPMWTFSHEWKETADILGDVAVSSDGQRLYATGNANTIALATSSGQLLWRTINTAEGKPVGSVVLTTANGPGGERVFIGGRTRRWNPFNEDFATIAYDPATGAQLWSAIADGPGHKGHLDPAAGTGGVHADHEWLTGIAAAPGGDRVYVTGLSGTFSVACARVYVVGDGCATEVAFRTLAYDAGDGREIWARGHGGPANTEAYVPEGIAVSPAGMVVVAGWHAEWYSDDAWFGDEMGVREDYADAITIAYDERAPLQSSASD
jgi:hypothetical protein